jgi:hypothetical protein
MTNDSMPHFFTLRFLSPSEEFSPLLPFLKFELKNSKWNGKVLKSGVSQLKAKQHFLRGSSRKRREK